MNNLVDLLNKVLARPIAFHRIFATVAGGATEGLFLSQAYYWSFRATLEGEWFYKSQEEWTEETALTRREQEAARKKLTELKILEVKRVGLPAKLHYKVNRSRLYELITEESQNPCSCQIVQSDKLDCTNEQTTTSDVTNNNVITSKQSIYTENTTENTAERKAPPAPRDDFGSCVEVAAQTPHPPATLLTKPESTHQTDRPSSSSIIPARENHSHATADRVRATWEKTGILPKIPMEMDAWAAVDLGQEVVNAYRRSGRITTVKRGDIVPEFALYVSNQYQGKDVDYGYAYLKKLEADPRQWETLGTLVMKWQASLQTGRNLNIAREVNRASKPLIELSL